MSSFTQYKKNPNEEDKTRLSTLFDEIFSTKTGYDELDKRIELTQAKKDYLLVVLDHPDTPLHNNPAELALRMYIIKRKISFGTRTAEGTKSWETFFTIMDTSRKLGVNTSSGCVLFGVTRMHFIWVEPSVSIGDYYICIRQFILVSLIHIQDKPLSCIITLSSQVIILPFHLYPELQKKSQKVSSRTFS